MQIPKNFAWTLFRESAAFKYFAWTKFRENGQIPRKSRKLIHAKFNPLKVFQKLKEFFNSINVPVCG